MRTLLACEFNFRMAFYTAVVYFERWQDDLKFRELGSRSVCASGVREPC
jgi:hypothetical protein